MTFGPLVRRGFTIIEILVAMTLTLAVFAITLPFVRAQTKALGTSAGRLDADQVARYAQRAIEHDLRLATADPGQPLLVHAGKMSIAFNANLLAADTLDPGAAEIETGAATTLTESWRLSNAATLPLTTRSYPAQDYLNGDGAISRNETISYFLRPDTITGRSDIYVLYRRVNARDSVQVVRGLQVPTDSSFFSYFRPVGTVLTRIGESRLPLYWDSVAVDSVRSVGIRAAGFFRNRTTGTTTIRTVQWNAVLPNASNRLTFSCGAAPGAASSVVATPTTASQPYRVVLTWNRSPDDDIVGGGDVRLYAVARRVSGAGNSWSTLVAVPASGANTYQWDHVLGPTAGVYDYTVRAVDCGGTSSVQASPATVTLP